MEQGDHLHLPHHAHGAHRARMRQELRQSTNTTREARHAGMMDDEGGGMTAVQLRSDQIRSAQLNRFTLWLFGLVPFFSSFFPESQTAEAHFERQFCALTALERQHCSLYLAQACVHKIIQMRTQFEPRTLLVPEGQNKATLRIDQLSFLHILIFLHTVLCASDMSE